MKRILLNGCSMVAGDEIAWKRFCIEYQLDIDWYAILDDRQYSKYFLMYKRDFRPKYNQQGMMSQKLKTDVVSLAMDGNSCDNIALSTINYLLSLTKEERQSYHVVIGWTCVTRKLHYNGIVWKNMLVSRSFDRHNDNVKNWMRYNIIETTTEEWYINYLRNILFLQNFLESNNITYTFYRSLRDIEFFHGPKLKDTIKLNNKDNMGNINLDSLYLGINNDNWLTFFDEKENYPAFGRSWTCYLNHIYKVDTEWKISEINNHPNEIATSQLVEILSNYLISKKLLEQ
jgi:hypothetical protein